MIRTPFIIARPGTAARSRTPAVMVPQAFTIVELLVVVSIVALLVSILLPALGRARRQARGVLCRTHLGQLYLANTGYALENDDYYVRAASDLFDGFGGRHRWHGVRQADGVDPDPRKNTFDPAKGPLREYLPDGRVKQCPELTKFTADGRQNAFEAGCGGYGYNAVGIGSRSYLYGYGARAMHGSMRTAAIHQPGATVMFTDTAFVQGFPQRYLIEYSFCEPPFRVAADAGGTIGSTLDKPAPSIHFRHLRRTNVAWADGHVSTEAFAFSKLAPALLKRFTIGWFGPDSNRLFRP